MVMHPKWSMHIACSYASACYYADRVFSDQYGAEEWPESMCLHIFGCPRWWVWSWGPTEQVRGKGSMPIRVFFFICRIL